MDAYLDQVHAALGTGTDFDTGWTLVGDRELRIAKTGFVIQIGLREPGAAETDFRHRLLSCGGGAEILIDGIRQALAELESEQISALPS